MKYLSKWVITYSVLGLISAFVGYAIKTNGELIGDWWLALLMLPLTTIFTFITLGLLYENIALFLQALGSLVFIGASIGYAIKHNDKWLYGVALGSTIISWHSVTVFFSLLSV